MLYTNTHNRIEIMRSATFTVRVDAAAKKRLERLAKSTGRSRSFLAAEAINEYLDVNEWQGAGSKLSIAAKAFPTSGSKIGSLPGAAVESGRSPSTHDLGLVP